MTNRLDQAYFDRIYENDDDPWSFESSWYERRKQALTMALLPKEHYASCFEPGCASGELTKLLSIRVDRVLGMELMPRIARRARTRLAGFTNVEVREGAIPDEWPVETFDLILLSEVVYYLNLEGLESAVESIGRTLAPGGHVVAVHYLGETDYPLTGSQTHELLSAKLGYEVVSTLVEQKFAALVLQR